MIIVNFLSPEYRQKIFLRKFATFAMLVLTLIVVVMLAGGLVLKDRSSDLAVVFSLLSTLNNTPISQKIAAIGELGLRGEIRKVSLIKIRIKELEKLGFTGVYLPESHKNDLKKEKYKIKLNYLSNIRELVERVSNSEKERDK